MVRATPWSSAFYYLHLAHVCMALAIERRDLGMTAIAGVIGAC